MNYHPAAELFPRATEVDVYFHQHHVIASPDAKQTILDWCKDHMVWPQLCDTPTSAFYGVWWAYMNCRDFVVHPGWENYLKQAGYLAVTELGAALSERVIEDAIVAKSELNAKHPARQVKLVSGIADVVTDSELYEIKAYLTRDAVLKAIGQLEVYSQELPGRAKIIVGRTGDGVVLRAFCQRLGISMRTWRRAK